jgi:DNA-directed RNA polymerase specialized sigma24 family protein
VRISRRRSGPRGGPPRPAACVKRQEIEASYEELFGKLVRRARWKHGLDEEDARDMVQEAFLIAIVKMGEVRHLGAWLDGAVDNLAINLRRTGGRRAKLLAFWGQTPAVAEDDVEEG